MDVVFSRLLVYPIVKQDGDNKNDCERNAGKRLLQKIRDEHPNLQLIVVEDGLASNAPHLRLLKSLDMHYLSGAKPKDHVYLYEEVSKAEGRVTTLRWTDVIKKKVVSCEIRFAHQLPLNESNADLLVNFLQYTEYASDGSILKRFSWVTDLRSHFRHCRVESMQQLHIAILYDLAKELPLPAFAAQYREQVP